MLNLWRVSLLLAVSYYVLYHIYRPQTKFAKVMFLHVCVCPQGGGGCLVPGGGVLGRGGVWSRWRPPSPTGTATAAGGTHPTGMYSCYIENHRIITEHQQRASNHNIIVRSNFTHVTWCLLLTLTVDIDQPWNRTNYAFWYAYWSHVKDIRH